MTDPRVEAGQNFCPSGFIKILLQNATEESVIRSSDIIAVHPRGTTTRIIMAAQEVIDTNTPFRDILLAIGDAEAPPENISHALSKELLAEMKKHLKGGDE